MLVTSHGIFVFAPLFFSPAGLREPTTAASSADAGDFSKEEGSDDVMTPTRPRTTEDLFAAIHRYRKLLCHTFIHFPISSLQKAPLLS